MPVAIKSTGGGSVTITAPNTASDLTLTLPNTNGTVATTTGTLTNPTINGFTGDTSVINVGSGQIYKDTSGNVGIGTSSPSTALQVNKGSSGTSYAIYADNPAGGGTTNVAGIGFSNGGVLKSSITSAVFNNDWMAFNVGGSGTTERARIDSSGNLLVGTTSLTQRLSVTGATEIGGFQNTSGTGNVRFFNSGGSTIGYIQWSGSSTSYVTSSDYRLKNSVAPMTTGLATVAALKPVTYKWNADDSDGEGFIAHELQSVIPHAVTGEKDAINEDGSIKPQGVDYSKIVVYLVAAIQELKADLDAAKAEIAALKGNV
ncbi:Intramolecular chaperone auto-processing domain containing protein [uncultured Caudovirales phage]|uniref:Intramolecular chaperone auto-processing domain containing protein n=1 Tax=uncultured Caudovirales phage TaxID=2100421 RepID=A0A6J7WAJ7_9CAUD|nr:Intramolecular chaperone auto-processing domain containing protein [uncultured Caudovirales phage]